MSIDHGKLLALADEWDKKADGYAFGGNYRGCAAELRALAQPAEAVEGDLDLSKLEDRARRGEALAAEVNDVLGMAQHGNDAAQGAVAPFAYGADLTPGDYDMEHSVWLLRPGESVPAGCTPLYTNPQAAPAQGDGVVVCRQGVQFGPNCWFSHEKITGWTAEELNNGSCGLTARKYMEWVSARIAAAPSQEGE